MNTETNNNGNVFKNKNFLLVFLGAIVSELGALLYSFAVGFYILEISDNNAFLQGLYLALCGISTLVFTPVGGVLGDRADKAKIMYICDYLKGGLIIAATVLMLVFRESQAHIVILFVLGILGNAVSGIFSPASGALLPHIVEENKLQQANSYFSMKNAFEGIIGIILAGILYSALPIHILFFIVGASFVASAISEMFIHYDFTPPEERLTLKVAFADMKDGIDYLRTKKAILAMTFAVLFINFFIAPVTGNFIPYFIKTDLASAPSYLFDNLLTPELWSSVVSVFFGISSLLGAAVMSALPQKEKCGFSTAKKLCIYAVLMIALTAGYHILVSMGISINAFLIVLCAGGLMMGFFLSLINIPLSTVLMRIVDKDKLSKVNSIISIGSQGMIPLASVLAGVIISSLGCTALLVFCSAGFAGTALMMLFNRHIREI
ncbi:MAG: MFS transporter [Clostridia bacterium]|nr:MFS transporter [Clostridia bacterium]